MTAHLPALRVVDGQIGGMARAGKL